jgi:hypothetical protein
MVQYTLCYVWDLHNIEINSAIKFKLNLYNFMDIMLLLLSVYPLVDYSLQK